MRDFLKILITLSLIPFLNGTFYILDSVIKKKGGGVGHKNKGNKREGEYIL